jgi:hypothetical protein
VRGMELSMFLMWLAIWSAGAIIVGGVIQGIKGAFPRLPTVVYKVAAPIISAVAALFVPNGEPVWHALGIYAASQLLYDVIIDRARREITGSEPTTLKKDQ